VTATLSKAGYTGAAVQAPAVTTVSDGGSSSSGAGAGASGSKSSGSSSSGGDGNIGVIAGAAAGGVVLIGGIVALILCLRMKKRAASDSSFGLVPDPAVSASRYDPDHMLTQDDAHLVTAPSAAAYDRDLLDVAVVSPMLPTLPLPTLPLHTLPVSALPPRPTEGPVVDLLDLDSETDTDGRSAVSMRLDDIRLGMTYEYAEASEASSIDVFAFRDETTIVNNLVAKNLGHVATGDDIPASTLIEYSNDAEEPGQQLRHVFKSPREYF
jgi:hypothetical protein